MTQPLPVGIFAASSVVPEIEFLAGVEHLKRNGFIPHVESQVLTHDFTFAGTDQSRAEAIYRLATDSSIPILWAARGGYGAGRLLPLLERLTQSQGVPIGPPKLLIGYSDVTVLHEFVRTRWGWSTLHAPMPAASNFGKLDPREWNAILDFIRTGNANSPWADTSLQWLANAPAAPLRGELVGGNLSMWATLAGTQFAQPAAGKILFFEDVGEAFYRIDRMVVQLEQSGALDGAAAIVLGDFTDCKDEDNQCLADAATGAKKSLRKVYDRAEGFDRIFGDLGRRTGIRIAQGLPVGHGPHYAPLPLGAIYDLSPSGKLSLLNWSWSERAPSKQIAV